MSTARYRQCYVLLLCFYPKPYRDRFAEGMEQTFNDLLRERRKAGKSLFSFVLWMFVETSAEIARENMRSLTPTLKKLKMPLLMVVASTAILAATYFANGADDPWYYVTAWVILLASLVPYSTTKGKDER